MPSPAIVLRISAAAFSGKGGRIFGQSERRDFETVIAKLAHFTANFRQRPLLKKLIADGEAIGGRHVSYFNDRFLAVGAPNIRSGILKVIMCGDEVLLESKLSLPLVGRGKVRDMYDFGDTLAVRGHRPHLGFRLHFG